MPALTIGKTGMAEYDFEESVGYWLTLATQAYHRVLAERLAPAGITHRQTHVIGWLKLSGELSQGELARKMLIEPPTLVRILDRMEAAGWVQRSGDPQDRRRRIVRLTEAAEPVWERIADCARELRQAAVTGMSDHESAQLKQLLQRVFANLPPPQPVRETVAAEIV